MFHLHLHLHQHLQHLYALCTGRSVALMMLGAALLSIGEMAFICFMIWLAKVDFEDQKPAL